MNNHSIFLSWNKNARFHFKALRKTLKHLQKNIKIIPSREHMSPQTLLHVAIVMDGNRRWTKRNNLPIFWGHRRGVHAVGEAVKTAVKNGISYLTLFAFSTENWKRPAEEVRYLMSLFSRVIAKSAKFLHEQNICVLFIGDLTAFEPTLFEKMAALQKQTYHNTKLHLTIAVNYGSRDEIVRVVRKIPLHNLQNCSWEIFQKYLDTGDLPDVDIFIRTAGELRLSNFLLLQSAYAELFFVEKCWPEFGSSDFEAILLAASQRKRTFGV